MKPSEFKISLLVESYDEKTAENVWNCYDSKKSIVSKPSKISITNFDSTIWRPESKLYQNLTTLSLIISEK